MTQLTHEEARIAAVARHYAAMMGCRFIVSPEKLADWRARKAATNE